MAGCPAGLHLNVRAGWHCGCGPPWTSVLEPGARQLEITLQKKHTEENKAQACEQTAVPVPTITFPSYCSAHVSGPKYLKTPAAWEIMLGRRRETKLAQ